MPLNATKPVQIGRYEITSFAVHIREELLVVHYEVGGNPPVPPRQATFTVPTANLAILRPDGAKTYHENLKALLYSTGQDLGIFPAGQVT